MRPQFSCELACRVALGSAALAWCAVGLTRGAEDPHARIRGMTVSCHRAGQVWGSDAMVHTMEELKQLGVNWITIHPYASIADDGTVGGGRLDTMYGDARWLTRPIAEAHRLGLKLMIKPHLAYWGGRFDWAGAIGFDSAEQWDRFFDTYAAWIASVARLCRDADAFVVGTELDRTLEHEARWREIIRDVRMATSVPLTYAAGWDAFERVGFWDALDAIGIQGYFPLVDHEAMPTGLELARSWSGIVERLEEYGRRHGRKVVLCELGYNRSRLAALRPWEYAQVGEIEEAEEVQRRCLDAALQALEHSEIVAGAFLWKWFPGEDGRRSNFLQSSPAMREVITAHWKHASGAAAAPASDP
jgi:hypothetical protein